MCGLAGFSGIKDVKRRTCLAYALGIGIDSRGGHAAGFVSVDTAASGKAPRMSKRIGTWAKASNKFIYAAGSGEVAMMHSRFATCGKPDDIRNAHPFLIRRKGDAVLYGVHNGVIGETKESAKLHGRDWSVDSKEVFELLADGNLKAIQELDGYGVLNWITPESGVVNMAKLSDKGDFVACTLSTGGIAWASTWEILSEALDLAKLKPENTLITSEVGRVYQLTPDGLIKTSTEGVKVGESKWKRDLAKRQEAWRKPGDTHNPYPYHDLWDRNPGMASYQSPYDHAAEDKARKDRLAKWRAKQADSRASNDSSGTPLPLAYGYAVGDIFTSHSGDRFVRKLSGWVKIEQEYQQSFKRDLASASAASAASDPGDKKAIQGMLAAGVKDETPETETVFSDAAEADTLPCGMRVAVEVVDDTADDDSWEQSLQTRWKAENAAAKSFNVRGKDIPLSLDDLSGEDLDDLSEEEWKRYLDAYRSDQT